MGVMGGGVADLDNDGYLDLYFGTGDPQLSRIEPNRIFHNNGNGTFSDATASAKMARPGQKGHGVAFADIDDDGDLDLYAQLGRHYPGDHAENAFYRNLTEQEPLAQFVLSPMLNNGGRLIGDFTLCRVADERFFVVGTYAAEVFYMRWFEQHLPPTGVSVRPCAMEYLGLSVAGPESRAVLQKLVDHDLSTAAFPFMSFARMDVGMVPALVGRVSFTGEMGYEMWVTSEYLRTLYDLLHEAGKAHGLKNFGGRALNSLRLEKSFGNWAREFRPIYGPYEAGLGRFVHLDKPGFIGKAAAAAEKASGGVRKLVTLAVDAKDADAIGDEPIWHGDKVVGWVTSGGYGHTVGKSIALGYVDNAVAGETSGFAVELMGDRRGAVRSAGALVDPQGLRMRA